MAVNRSLGCVKLTADELTTNFASGSWAEKYPPILTIAQAADMLQVPVGTLRFWRTTGRLNGSSRRYGRVLRSYRDEEAQVTMRQLAERRQAAGRAAKPARGRQGVSKVMEVNNDPLRKKPWKQGSSIRRSSTNGEGGIRSVALVRIPPSP